MRAKLRIIGAAAAFSCFLAACVQSVAGQAKEAPRWSEANVSALIGFVEAAGEKGLDPARYDAAGLRDALSRGDAVAVELAASELFRRAGRDLAEGVTPADLRVGWRIAGSALADEAISQAMEEALEQGTVGQALAAFEPPHRDYRALEAALASAPQDDVARRETLRLNMERWRWMPRDLGENYVLVNAPSFEAIVVRGGEIVARKRVIVGAVRTPTPQFSAHITGVVFNPTWFVPTSIVRESVGALMRDKPEEAARLGYYVGKDGGIRQKPGPANALGRMKLVMPNPYSVYLHDTPSKANFNRDNRALSHGCVRVDDALGFAQAVIGDGWDEDKIAEVVETGSTVTVDLAAPLPVYIAYFTAMTDAEGKVGLYPDIYGLDKALLAERAAAPVVSSAQDVLGECPPA